MSTVLRPITLDDHAAVLAWNEADVELLAPLDAARLGMLLDLCDTGAVILADDGPAGFVFTFAHGSPYDSPNYRWHGARHPEFVYLDRIVIDPRARRTGLAGRVYDELEADAARRAPVFCLEINAEPPNDPSLAFHRNRGFTEVGRQEFGDHTVALFEKDLRARG